MESLQRKLIYYLYDWNEHLKKKRFLWANDDVIQRVQMELAVGEKQRRIAKKYFSIWLKHWELNLTLHRPTIIGTSRNALNQDLLCLKDVFGIFSIFPWDFLPGDICGTPEHQFVTSYLLLSCQRLKHKIGTCFPSQ